MLTLTRRSRFASLAIASLMLVASGGVAQAADVQVSRSTWLVAQVVWGDADETGLGTSGGIAVFAQNADAGLNLWEMNVVEVTCDAGTADPSDDYLAQAGSFRSGDGPATEMALASNLRSATASGTMTIYSGTFDQCAQAWTITDIAVDVPVGLDLVAVGRGETSVQIYREQVPGEYRLRDTFRDRGYHATGTAMVGGEPVDYADAIISRFSISSHILGG